MEQNIIGTISVEELRLSIKKGLYDSEKLTENQFSISANVSYNINEINKEEYLDYSVLASILKIEMQKDIHLLETIAQNCINAIRIQWPFSCVISIKIKKVNPDFAQLHLKSVAVEMHWKA